MFVLLSTVTQQGVDGIVVDPNNPLTWTGSAAFLTWMCIQLFNWYTGKFLPYRQQREQNRDTFEQTQEQTQDEWYREMIKTQQEQQREGMQQVNNTLLKLSEQMLKMTELQGMSLQLHSDNHKMLTVQNQIITQQLDRRRAGGGKVTATAVAAKVTTEEQP